MKILGCSAATLRRHIKENKVEAVGKGPARRVILESIEKSGLPRQQDLTGDMLSPDMWHIVMRNDECRWRTGANLCHHRNNVIASRDFGTEMFCQKKNCPLGVATPCKSKLSK